ncbi:MAG: PH domain-containing protein [Bacteroidetes bacterium]|nr:PH domain-containing protein [Bacteroidota bacterium]
MKSLSFKPDTKLKFKYLLIFLSVMIFELFIGILLQIFIPIGGKHSSTEVAIILWPIIAGSALLLLIIALPISILWINNLNYSIDLERISIHKGIITKIQQNIPYYAITDFILQRSLFDRFLGIASIRIQTAGQSTTPTGYEGNLAGIKEWNQLLNELRARLNKESANTIKTNDMSINSSDDKLSDIISELKEIKELLRKRN